MQMKFTGFFFRDAKVIPIAGRYEDKEILENALATIEKALRDGEIVCIFPEGGITRDGELQKFKKGLEVMLEKVPVPVVPMTLHGLWGSFFSRKYGKALSKPSVILNNWFGKVELNIYDPWQPEDVTAAKLEELMREKLTENPA